MAQPTPYARQADFSDIQAAAPSTPLPGNLVDQELDAVKQTLDETLGNLVLIQRDDGKLANQVVTVDSLDALVRAGLDTPVAWAAATAYALNDTVWESNILYAANVAHTSGATFAGDAANWDTLAFFQDNANFVAKSGDTMTGELTVPTDFSIKGTTPGETLECKFLTSSAVLLSNIFVLDDASPDLNLQVRDSVGVEVSRLKIHATKMEFLVGGAVTFTFDSAKARSGILGDIHVFDSAGVTQWTKPAGLKFIRWRGCGTGGNGAGCATTTASQCSVGGCGGGGAYGEGIIQAADLGATEDVTIVNPVTAGTSTGADGGSTTFGSHVTLPGGKGGATQSAGTGVRMGAGGAASANGGHSSGIGIVFCAGQAGGATIADASNNVAVGGPAGSSGFGGGPRTTINGNGVDAGLGVNAGAGGGGTANLNSQGTARTGGRGARGVFIIEEYY